MHITFENAHKLALKVLRDVLVTKLLYVKHENFFTKEVHTLHIVKVPSLCKFLTMPQGRIYLRIAIDFETQRRKALTDMTMAVIDAIILDLDANLVSEEEIQRSAKYVRPDLREFNETQTMDFIMGDRYEDCMFIFKPIAI